MCCRTFRDQHRTLNVSNRILNPPRPRKYPSLTTTRPSTSTTPADTSKTVGLVETAAQQGKYEQMYNKMFQTQAQWGEQQETRAPLFRTFAQELELDMAAYDVAVLDETTKDRIRKDIADGKALGVTGTPTFFLNGEKLELTSEADFRQQLTEAAQ